MDPCAQKDVAGSKGSISITCDFDDGFSVVDQCISNRAPAPGTQELTKSSLLIHRGIIPRGTLSSSERLASLSR